MRKLYRAASHQNQSRIPQFFKILNKMQLIVKKNLELEKSLSLCLKEADGSKEITTSSISGSSDVGTEANTNAPTILKIILQTAQKNSKKNKKGSRYEETLKLFAAYIKMLAGRLSYETLYKNMPNALPSPTSVNRYIYENGPSIVEGQLRIAELKKYLDDRQCCPMVWISEDATGITGKVEYDPKTNQIIGFELPYDKGMPVPYTFMARNAREIEHHFTNKNEISRLVYVIMAQPLQKKCSPVLFNSFWNHEQI